MKVTGYCLAPIERPVKHDLILRL